jgi:hypothetical protein
MEITMEVTHMGEVNLPVTMVKTHLLAITARTIVKVNTVAVKVVIATIVRFMDKKTDVAIEERKEEESLEEEHPEGDATVMTALAWVKVRVKIVQTAVGAAHIDPHALTNPSKRLYQ